MTHELKIQKQWADAKLAGEKPFEIRRNDRGFQKGDVVHYTVVDPKTGEPWKKPSGEILYGNDDGRHPLEQCDFIITYVREGADGLEKGYCVYADQAIPRNAAARERPVECRFYDPDGVPTGSMVCKYVDNELNCQCRDCGNCGKPCPYKGNPVACLGLPGRHG